MSLFLKLTCDVFLHFLQFCDSESVENTRAYQSEGVQHRTAFTNMRDAVRHQNLGNMKWIKDRKGHDKKNCTSEAARNGNLEILKWLIVNGYRYDFGKIYINTQCIIGCFTRIIFHVIPRCNPIPRF